MSRLASILLAVAGCRVATSDECACGEGEICVLDRVARCEIPPAACGEGFDICTSEATDACQEEVCGYAPELWVQSCEAEGVDWISCD